MNDFENKPFDDYILSCIKRMKALRLKGEISSTQYKDGEFGFIRGRLFRIEETFKNVEELEASGRREIYPGYEQENIRNLKNGSFIINSICFIYPTYIDEDKTKLISDSRYFAVANLYPYIMKKYPEYAKKFIGPEYDNLKLCKDENFLDPSSTEEKKILDIFTSEAIDFQTRLFEKLYYETSQKDEFDLKVKKLHADEKCFV